MLANTRRTLKLALCLAALSLQAGAADAGKLHPQPGTLAPRSTKALKISARVAALINADGTIVHSKGVYALSTPNGPGFYCVTLLPGIDASKATPVLTFDFDSSEDWGVFIAYTPFQGAANCPANSIGIRTYTTDSGTHVLTPEGFTIVVP